MKKPLLTTVGLDWLRYMNARNQDNGRTPLSPEEITQIFAYVQLLEERLSERGAAFADLREHVGLGTGLDGTGMPSRRVVRERLRRIEQRARERRVNAQRISWLGCLPVYTARFERSGQHYIGSVDEMPGVAAQGQTLAAAIASLADCVRLAVRVSPRSKRRRRAVTARGRSR